jgi:hypothetical protein
MRRTLLAVTLCFASMGLDRPVQAQQARILCTLDVREKDSLRLRAGPGPQHREVGRIAAGACGITVDERSCVGRWCIISHEGRSGWANTHFLGIYASETKAPPPVKTP